MIKFSLACDRGHTFESWFPCGEEYDGQVRRGLVVCPDCDSKQVRKAPMAPAVMVGRRPKRAEEPSATQPVALLDERQLELRAALSALRREIEARTDDVGHKFPEVARAIHAGDEAERAIGGALRQPKLAPCSRKAIGVMPLPILPDEAT